MLWPRKSMKTFFHIGQDLKTEAVSNHVSVDVPRSSDEALCCRVATALVRTSVGTGATISADKADSATDIGNWTNAVFPHWRHLCQSHQCKGIRHGHLRSMRWYETAIQTKLGEQQKSIASIYASRLSVRC